MMIALLALGAFAFWGAIFLVFLQADGRSFWDVFLGEVEPPPEELGIWQSRPELSEQAHEIVEERILLEGSGKSGRLLRQRRVRSIASGELVRVLPEEKIPRRRNKVLKGDRKP